MRVWIVQREIAYEFTEVVGVYDNEAAALKHKELCPDENVGRHSGTYFTVDEWEVATETDLEQLDKHLVAEPTK